MELNAHQGNPMVVAQGGRVVAAGNFDIVPLAAALDFLRIALAPALTSAAERALKMLQSPLTGLPEGLAARPHLAEPALSELGAAVQGIVAEARLLAQPVSFELASTTQHEGIEDRTTMAPLGARRLAEMVSLGARVVAIELTIAAQAVDLRGSPALGAGTARAYQLVRERVPFTDAGETISPDLDPVVELVRSDMMGSVSEGLLERLDKGPVICAEGYLFELERRGYLQAGAFVPEVVLDHPEVVAQLHRDFVHAGSDVVEAFTYYAHREKMRIVGKEHLLEELNRRALAIAKEVADESGALFAGDICNTNVYADDAESTERPRGRCSRSRSAGLPRRASTSSSRRPSRTSPRHCSPSR